MTQRTSLALPVLAPIALLAVVLVALALSRTSGSEPKRYVCPPCGLPCDTTVYNEPGTCPKCGMALIEADAASAASAKQKRVGILVFDGVQIIDYTGPYEIFQAADFDVYTVAATKDPITTVAGMKIVPKYSMDDAPLPDVLVVPGGGIGGALASAPTIAWVKATSAKTQRTLSVCNGAFILAKAGLLDGMTATTTNGNIPRLRSEYPKIKVVDDQRFVDNGKIITAGGLTAGIDGALHVVSTISGPGVAQEVALGEEYDWRPERGFVRGLLADMNFKPWIDSSLDEAGQWRLLGTTGGTDRWDIIAEGTSDLSPADLTDRFQKACVSQGKWTPVHADGPAASADTVSHWAFIGRDGKPWKGTFTVSRQPASPKQYVLKLAIKRADL